MKSLTSAGITSRSLIKLLAHTYICVCALCTPGAQAYAAGIEPYRIQPGDIVTVSAWKEPDLQAELLVRPDGALSFPLAGELAAAGQTVEELHAVIEQRLQKYIPGLVVTVGVKLIGGNHVYVLGKVNRPGDFQFAQPIDVMQALSLAGGATPFAALNDIQILRRENGSQTAIPFHYGDVEKGKSLQQNVLLRSGDTVVVP